MDFIFKLCFFATIIYNGGGASQIDGWLINVEADHLSLLVILPLTHFCDSPVEAINLP